jgi:predicted nucleotidyltransferase
MDLQLLPHRQRMVDRFVAACQRDERVAAALLFGSYVRGAADDHSDLDLCLITTDEAYEAFTAGREAFVRLLGEPLFVESFDLADILFLIFSDGTEVELNFSRESQIKQMLSGPFKVLLDKTGVLAGAAFHAADLDTAAQTEKLRRLVYWFWHDLSHFITAVGRGYLWWGYGQLEVLRRYCVDLARLQQDFGDRDAADDSYWKLEKVLPIAQLVALEATFCPMEREAMLQAGRVIVGFFCEVAPILAKVHGITYPAELERVMVSRLEALSHFS